MVAEAAMAGGAVVDTGPTDGAEAERLAGVEEAARRDFGNRVAVKNAVHKFAPYLSD
jgi:hypothetical protein